MAKKLFLLLVCFIAAGFIMGSVIYASTGTMDNDSKVRIKEAYGKLPLYFIENKGQVDKKVKYYEKGGGHTTFFTKEGVYITLQSQNAKDKSSQPPFNKEGIKVGFENRSKGELVALGLLSSTQGERIKDMKVQSETVKLFFLNANKNPEIVAEELQEGKVDYFTGNDSRKWKKNIPTYRTVLYKEIYKGIDVRFYGNNRQLEYDIIVKPGADPSKVKFSYEGIEGLKVTEDGDMEIALHSPSSFAKEGKGEGGNFIQKRPIIYQEISGKKVAVDGKFKIFNSTLTTDHSQLFSYGFQVAAYDKNHPLIIDPVLVYSTYLGGSNLDWGFGIAVDTSGSAYITGFTWSTDFPTVLPIQGAHAVGDIHDVFVTKIDSSGTNLVYSTYLGGSSYDTSSSIAVDAFGNAYITGTTGSTDFPTASPIQGAFAGSSDAFVTKIDSSGSSLVYSTFLGGSSSEEGHGIAVDASGNAYITGITNSTNFPTVSPIQGGIAGVRDAFITKINASGGAFVYSTYLGGSGDDVGRGIAVDTGGNAYVTGYTNSTNFPIVSPIQGTNTGGYDVFITKVDVVGSSLVYSTYLGGSDFDFGIGIAVDTFGNAYITGNTRSTNFPTASPIYGTYGGGFVDAFVTKINTLGSALSYSTFLGGNTNDLGIGIAVDTSGNAYITGITGSTDFPTASPIQGAFAGSSDAFVTKIDSSGSSLVYSTFLGGSSSEEGHGIAVDASGNAYITGRVGPTLPTASPIQGTYGGGDSDAFVAKISDTTPVITVSIDIKPGSFPNAIKLQDTGNVPVAILSSNTFDATEIDISTLELNGAGVRIVKGKGYQISYGDVNGDNLFDLVVHFDRGEVQLTVGDTYATVTGKTLEGIQFKGTDSVKVIE